VTHPDAGAARSAARLGPRGHIASPPWASPDGTYLPAQHVEGQLRGQRLPQAPSRHAPQATGGAAAGQHSAGLVAPQQLGDGERLHVRVARR